MNKIYEENGICLSKKIVREGTELEIVYSGLLFVSGAENIFLHIGYNENWDNKEDIPMQKIDEGFKAKFTIASYGTLNFAFRDGANNWDNNSGENYKIKTYKKIHRKSKKNA